MCLRLLLSLWKVGVFFTESTAGYTIGEVVVVAIACNDIQVVDSREESNVQLPGLCTLNNLKLILVLVPCSTYGPLPVYGGGGKKDEEGGGNSGKSGGAGCPDKTVLRLRAH